MRILHADTIASRGLALGRVQVYHKRALEACRDSIAPELVAAELGRYERATEAAIAQLSALAEQNALFQAHIDLLGDFALVDCIRANIQTGLQNCELAVENAVGVFREMLESTGDDYMRERGADVQDIGDRLLRILQGAPEDTVAPDTQGPLVILADDLAPSDTARMELGKVVGFVTQRGGVTGHVAIMARGMGIPAFVGVQGILQEAGDGDAVILDALEGKVILRPDEDTAALYREKQAAWQAKQAALLEAGQQPAATVDGVAVKVYANAGCLEDVYRAAASGADGIGLFRTEFLYMDSDRFPTEEEQFAVHREAVTALGGEITIRTLDIGGDKALPYFPFDREENPFLGWRAIRVCLSMPELFKTQLRAILRASAFGKLRILYPMIISCEELAEANALLAECKAELEQEGVAFDRDIAVGMMVETPAAVILAEDFAQLVQFFSIGTNDLTQYLLAVDRGNERIAPLYDPFHPAVLRSIDRVIKAGHAAGIEVGMCGEFAAEPRATRLLVGLGLDELSVAAGSVPDTKAAVRGLHMGQAAQYAKNLCACRNKLDREAVSKG